MSEFDQDSEAAAQFLLERRKTDSALPPGPRPPKPINMGAAQQLAAALKQSAPKGK